MKWITAAALSLSTVHAFADASLLTCESLFSSAGAGARAPSVVTHELRAMIFKKVKQQVTHRRPQAAVAVSTSTTIAEPAGRPAVETRRKVAFALATDSDTLSVLHSVQTRYIERFRKSGVAIGPHFFETLAEFVLATRRQNFPIAQKDVDLLIDATFAAASWSPDSGRNVTPYQLVRAIGGSLLRKSLSESDNLTRRAWRDAMKTIVHQKLFPLYRHEVESAYDELSGTDINYVETVELLLKNKDVLPADRPKLAQAEIEKVFETYHRLSGERLDLEKLSDFHRDQPLHGTFAVREPNLRATVRLIHGLSDSAYVSNLFLHYYPAGPNDPLKVLKRRGYTRDSLRDLFLLIRDIESEPPLWVRILDRI